MDCSIIKAERTWRSSSPAACFKMPSIGNLPGSKPSLVSHGNLVESTAHPRKRCIDLKIISGPSRTEDSSRQMLLAVVQNFSGGLLVNEVQDEMSCDVTEGE